MYTYSATLVVEASCLVLPIRGMSLAIEALRQFERMNQPCCDFANYLGRLIREARGEVIRNVVHNGHRITITRKQVELWKGGWHFVSYTLEDALKTNRLRYMIQFMAGMKGKPELYEELYSLINDLAHGRKVKVDLPF